MIERVRCWVEQELKEAEAESRCLIATTRMERGRLKTAAAEGLAREVLPSVFAPAHVWDEASASKRMRLKMRALQTMHSDWVFAGPSAACAYGLAVSNRFIDKVVVATSRSAHRSASAHTRGIIVADDVVEKVDDLRVTSLQRTVGDCLRQMDFRSGVAVADSALRIYKLGKDKLEEGVATSCARSEGMRRMRAVIRLADARAESGGESIARATMLELGFAMPDLQRPFCDPTGVHECYFADYAWDVSGGYLLGELDGHEKYVNVEMRGGKTLGQVLDAEHRRQSLIEGYENVVRVIRFGFADVMRTGDFLQLLTECGVPRTYALDDRVVAAGGILRFR